MADELTLNVTPALGGKPIALSGWMTERVTRGIERVPSDFQITATERNPFNPQVLQIFPGDQIEVLLGNDRVLTGYIDRVIPSMSADSHSIVVVGRSKCCDLVDCSAMFNTFQFNAADVAHIAAMLCKPFGIKVDTVSGAGAGVIPLMTVNMTETPYEIIERITRAAAVLAYDGTDGNLILSSVGTTSMSSGFAQGQNVQAATAAFTMDQRYQKISAVLLTNEFLLGDAAPPDEANALSTITEATAVDPGVFRYRPLLLVAEQNDPDYRITKQRVQWEVNRRYGRSQAVRLICDSWRDSAGKLWEINTLANVDLPALKIRNATWLISEVSFLRDAQGTRAEVTLMPPEAFQPAPIVLLNDPYLAAIAAAQNQETGASKAGATSPAGRAPTPAAGGAAK